MTVKIDRRGPVVRVALNRPEVRNAFNARMIDDLASAFDGIGRSDARVVVLEGEGKLFCAGADVEWMRASAELTEAQNRADAGRMAAMFAAINECPKPVIGRIHGAALGGGTGLAACCDIAVAAEGTVFSFSEAKLGIIPAVISTFVLPKIGSGRARRYFLTAERFDAAVAREIGLVHEVTADLDGRVEAIVRELLTSGPCAVAEAKALIQRGASPPDCADTIARLRASPEGQEGLRAFLEKRRPSWHG